MSSLSAPSRPISWLVRILLKPTDALLEFIGPRYTLYFWFYKKTPASWIEFLSRLRPIVKLYKMSEGPFDVDSGKIKQTRIITLARGS